MIDFNPEEKEFDKIRHYPADELTIDQMEIITANRDKLNDEEKDAFAHIIEDEEFIEDASDDEEPDAGKKPDPSDKDDKGDDDDAGDDADEGVPQLKTKADIDAYVAEQTKKALEEANLKKQTTTNDTSIAETEEEKLAKKLDDPNWKPATPKEYYDVMRAKDKVDAARASTKADEQRKAIDKRLNDEIDALVKAKKIPDKNSEEGKKIIAQLATIGEKRNLGSFNDAYEEWQRTPVEFGGGYDPTKSAADKEKVKEKEQLRKQKQAAGKISVGKGEAPSTKAKPIPYDQLKKMHIDDITDYALEQYKK